MTRATSIVYESKLGGLPPMKAGLWVWPSDQRGQRRTLRKVYDSPHLNAALQALAKSKEGLSNAELDDVLTDNSGWLTRWVVDQLISLGFAGYNVDFFGGPGKYELTELGREAYSAITGKPVQKPSSIPASPQAPAISPKP